MPPLKNLTSRRFQERQKFQLGMMGLAKMLSCLVRGDDIDDSAADDDIDDDADDLPGRQPQDWSRPCNTGLPRDARTRQSLSALELEQGFGKRWV